MSMNSAGVARLSVGLGQGIALYLLRHAADAHIWPAPHPALFVPLYMIACIVPLLLLTGWGELRPRSMALWAAGAALVLAALGVHDVLRRADGASGPGWPLLAPTDAGISLWIAAAFGFFIAQALVMGGERARRPLAPYPDYFDIAWKLAVQLSFSAAFLGAFWLVMWMGMALFGLVHMTFLQDLTRHSWFDIPLSAVAFAYAIDLTDVRAAIVRGIRTLKLILLSWLLPVMAAFAVIFLVSLPFKGASLLWSTHHATQIMLGAAAWLILLINAAYQDGDPEHRPGRLLRVSAVVGAAVLPPLVLLAAYALWLRVGHDGWTVNMIVVAACLILAACYSGGYLAAILPSGPWMKRIEKTNIFAAYLALALIVALNTPVADQLWRLESGKVTPGQFDYAYLRQAGQRYGAAALDKLKTDDGGAHKEEVEKAIASPWAPRAANGRPSPRPVKEINVYPVGKALPDSFKNKDWDSAIPLNKRFRYPLCLFDKTQECDAYVIGDDTPPMILLVYSLNYGNNRLFSFKGGDWTPVGQFPDLLNCAALRAALKKGDYIFGPSRGKELTVGGLHISVQDQQCPEE